MHASAALRKAFPWLYRAAWVVVFLAVALIVLYRLSGVEINLRDMDAYWQAALRLREGGSLYDSAGRLDGENIYRYAPWFAYAWVPLTYLPKAAVGAIWTGVLVLATGLSVLPAIASRTAYGIALGSLCMAFLAWQTGYGNVHPLMIAALVLGASHRTGPVWIALAASLKVTPGLYLLVYAARGEWRKVGVGLALLAVLVLPMLAFDLSDYPFAPGNRPSLLYVGVWAYAIVAAAASVIAWLVARRSERFAWLAGSCAVFAAVPRLLVYDLAYLLVGAQRATRGDLPATAAPTNEL